MPLSPEKRNELYGLIRGTMLIVSSHKRSSTHATYATGTRANAAFAEAFDFPTLPVTPLRLMAWCSHGLAVAKLDSSTIKNRVLAIGDTYDYMRSVLRLSAVRNPLRDPQLIAYLRTMGVNYKKQGGGSIAISFAQLEGLFKHGFVATTRRARWARLFCIFLNFLMLRNTACQSLTVSYEIVAGRVVFLPDSQVWVEHNAQFGGDALMIRVTSDKNMTAQKAAREGSGRLSGCPAELPNFGVFPGMELVDYLLDLQPPSGGPLFAFPDKKSRGFAVKPSASFNSYLRNAYLLAFPNTSAEYIKRLGSHSGRKTLAQLLWEAGMSKRFIADTGGWFVKQDAMDLYFKTSIHTVLRVLASLNKDGTTLPSLFDRD